MRKLFAVFFLTTILLIGCGKDDIKTVVSDNDVEETNDVIPTEFSDTINIVFSVSGDATVTGTTAEQTVSISGNEVTITNTGDSLICYILSGNTTNGFFKLYSSRKQAVQLKNVSITNPNGAAINIQSKKSAFIVVSGKNTLADGASYTQTPSTEDEKATLFSEGQLIFMGTGTLNINATGKSAIVSDDYIRFTGSPAININSTAGNGIKGKQYIIVEGGTININVSADIKKGMSSDSLIRFNGGETTIAITGGTAYDSENAKYSGTAGVKADIIFEMLGGDLNITNSGQGGKGISSDGNGTFSGGNIDIRITGTNYTSNNQSITAKGIKFDGNITFSGSNVSVIAANHEAIESKGTITISDGEVYAHSSDDAINSGSTMTITGGFVGALSTGNDGIDANGNCYLQGGVIYAIGAKTPEVAVDANTEEGYKLYLNGGTIIAIGGLERNSQLTQACYSSSSWSKSTWYSITVGSTTHAFKTPSSGGTTMVVSGSEQPTVTKDVTVNGGTSRFNETFYSNCATSGGTSVSLSSYTGNGWGPHKQ